MTANCGDQEAREPCSRRPGTCSLRTELCDTFERHSRVTQCDIRETIRDICVSQSGAAARLPPCNVKVRQGRELNRSGRQGGRVRPHVVITPGLRFATSAQIHGGLMGCAGSVESQPPPRAARTG